MMGIRGQRLHEIRAQLRERGWALTCFSYEYKKEKYFVFVRDYRPPEGVPQYSLVELTFADSRDLNRSLTAPANEVRLMIGAQTLREFFGIAWAPNLGDLLGQFYARLYEKLPDQLPDEYSPEVREAVVHQLSRSDAEDPSKVYCTGVRRNPARVDGSLGRRSLFNAQKTQILRPTLYGHLAAEENLSFCYSSSPGRERTDSEILQTLAREGRRS